MIFRVGIRSPMYSAKVTVQFRLMPFDSLRWFQLGTNSLCCCCCSSEQQQPSPASPPSSSTEQPAPAPDKTHPLTNGQGSLQGGKGRQIIGKINVLQRWPVWNSLFCELVKRGCWFLHEQPWTAASWKLECVRKRVSTYGVELRRGDQSSSQIVSATNPTGLLSHFTPLGACCKALLRWPAMSPIVVGMAKATVDSNSAAFARRNSKWRRCLRT